MKNLSKRSRLKKRKQRLTDRINQCKSSKELDEWEKVFSYHPVLKDDEQWDYCFLLSLIRFKLTKMSEYFYTHHIIMNEDWKGQICDKLVNLLDAAYNSGIVLNSDLKTYVNTRNEKRFFTEHKIKWYEENPIFKEKYKLAELREAKAISLFWKYFAFKINDLWD